MRAARQKTSSALFVICIVSFFSVLPAGSNAIEAMPMPKESDWLAYKSVETAIASAEKNPGKRISRSDLEGWLAAKNWLTDGKHDYTFRRWQRNYSHEPYYAGDIKRFAESNTRSKASVYPVSRKALKERHRMSKPRLAQRLLCAFAKAIVTC
jgi:hypothetical protein